MVLQSENLVEKLSLMGSFSWKASPTSFSTLTSRNVGISSEKVLNFSFNLFARLVQKLGHT